MKQVLLKILLAIICAVFWLWIGFQNLVPSGKFEASTDFTSVNPWLPGLRPIERVINRNTIIGDPIYLDIKLPTRFDELRLRIDAENRSKGDFRVGIFTNKDKWQILFGEFKNNEYIFDLRGLRLEKNIVPVVFGAPKATVGEPVIINKIDIVASKPPLTLSALKQLLSKLKFLLLFIISLVIVFWLWFLVILPISVSTFAVIVAVGSFFDASLLELWRPGLVANFVDSRFFILLFIVVASWYWLEHKKNGLPFAA